MKKRHSMHWRILMMMLIACASGNVHARDIYFDTGARKERIVHPDYAPLKTLCMVPNVTLEVAPEPIEKLIKKQGYGTDRSLQPLSWHVMINGSRALAGDKEAKQQLENTLFDWANANALLATESHYDPHYALKRALLPLIVNFSIIQKEVPENKRHIIETWLGKLVDTINVTYGGDVDRNNHRLLRDSVVMAWGAYTGNDKLIQQGIEQFEEAMRQIRKDGSLPLETRRGARAIWYMRHAMTSMAVIEAIASLHDDTLWKKQFADKKQADQIVHFMLDSIESPLTILPYAAENVIPGKSKQYIQQEVDSLFKPRGHGRFYFAFAEILMNLHSERFSVRRLASYIKKESSHFRPFIDEYAGGNISCFFYTPPTGEHNE